MVNRPPPDAALRVAPTQQTTGASMSYFKPWRRRLGFVTLLLACVFMAGWLRTFRINDQIILSREDQSNVLTSKDGCLRCTRYFGLILPAYSREASVVGAKFGVSEPIDVAETTWESQWRWCGFDFRTGRLYSCRVEVSTIPYWSVVFPLTLLSACLLLSMPRQKPTRVAA